VLVLINCEIEAETQQNILNKLKSIPGVIEASEISGVYDIIVKIASNNIITLKENITRDIKTIDKVRSTMTLIVVE
jgi:DNA-binding Lrp family transcriptional regulator